MHDAELAEATTRVQLVQHDGTTLPVPLTLHYDPADPWATRAVFLCPCGTEACSGEPIEWTFARDTLAEGLDGHAGLGDVRVWPWSTPRSGFVALALSSPDGLCLFKIPRSALVRFLRRSYLLVPKGREGERIDWDAEMRHILPAKRKPNPKRRKGER